MAHVMLGCLPLGTGVRSQLPPSKGRTPRRPVTWRRLHCFEHCGTSVMVEPCWQAEANAEGAVLGMGTQFGMELRTTSAWLN